MAQQQNSPFSAFNTSFADGAARFQALAMEGVASIFQLQASEFGHQARASSEFVTEVMALRDNAGLRSLWEKGSHLGRDSLERNAAFSQEVIAITQRPAESLTALLQTPPQAVTDTVAASNSAGKRAGSK